MFYIHIFYTTEIKLSTFSIHNSTNDLTYAFVTESKIVTSVMEFPREKLPT